MYDEYDDQVTARYYDAAYAVLPTLGPDIDFYRELARESGGPVLEIGCGTGRVLSRIAVDGLDCCGIDASKQMLERCRGKLSDSVRLDQADTRDSASATSAMRTTGWSATSAPSSACAGSIATSSNIGWLAPASKTS